MITYESVGIEIPAGKTTGQIYTTCPKCSESRKKKNDKCLGVNLNEGIWHCVHCEWKGSIHKKQYSLPKWENNTNLSDSVIDWFLQRNIGQEVLNKMKVSQDVVYLPQVERKESVICFNYFRGESLVNVKYRSREKHFRLYKDAELIFYNLNGIYGKKEIFITEGECDALVMIQAGMESTASVPNGANAKSNNLEYLNNCYEAFENAESVYIVTDNDNPGETLANELARRIGIERCYRVNLGEYKDVNEALNKGEKISSDWIKQRSTPYPMVGVYSVDSFWDDLISIRKNGFPQGWKPRSPLGEKIIFYPGYLTIVTGIPNSGKSEYLDQILIELGIDYGLKGAYFSPENYPTTMHLIKLIEKLGGKNFWKASISEINNTKNWLNDRFHWIYPDDGFDLTNVLEHIRKAVMRYGINWYVLDPWNKLDHQYTGQETAYISKALDQISNFNRKNNLHGFIVAHPTKMDKDKDGNYLVPNLYSISGSAHFFNKTDIGITVYKKEEGYTDVHIQKVKFKYWGGVGKLEYRWDSNNGRYTEQGQDPTNWLNVSQKQESIYDEVPF